MCALIMFVCDYILTCFFQHAISHGRVSKVLRCMISLLGKNASFITGILVVANPSSSVLQYMNSIRIGF